MSARSSAATCRRASPCWGKLPKRSGLSRAICCVDPLERAKPPPQVLIKARTSFSSANRCMGSLGDGDEIEALVEGPCLIILGVDGEGSKAGDLGRRERSGERVLQETGPDPFSRPRAGDREAREDHQGNRMPGDAALA